MRQEDSDSGPTPLPPVLADDLGDVLDDVAAPNCAECLVPMEIDGEGSLVRWQCPECGLVRV